jgi:hypothetical protein
VKAGRKQIYIYIISLGGVGPSPLGTSATWPISPAPYDDDNDHDHESGAISGVTGRRNRSTRRKPAPMPLYPPQIPHDKTLARTRVAAVESRRLTAWAMSRQA